MALKAIFLDAGGTLIHLDRAFILAALAEVGLERDHAAFEAAYEAARFRMDELMRSHEPGDDATRWRVFWGVMMQVLEVEGEPLKALQLKVIARHQEGRLWTAVEPGAVEALEELRRRGLILGVVSNADGRVESFLELAGLRRYLDFVVDSGAVGVEKPDPRIFEIALERAGVAPHEVVHVGDIYEIDVVGAGRAGIAAVMVDPKDQFGRFDCERIRSVAELPAWLDAREGARIAVSA